MQIIGGMFNHSVARLLISQGISLGDKKKDSYILDDTSRFECTTPMCFLFCIFEFYQILFQYINQEHPVLDYISVPFGWSVMPLVEKGPLVAVRNCH
jgi:hypothetical protein